MVAAINQTEELQKYKYVSCFAHTLNLGAEVATGHPTVSPLISKVREIVKWVKESVINDQIRQKQRESGIEGDLNKIILYGKTRWNSMFYMIERLLELQEVVNPILLKTIRMYRL
ncbi:unnamed protein product [Psylliodes chrysocephalus]|uniref:Uncharacterized protein n=1 Tax=Psylliodes chrysocephalus TaxID=3402493 RepID=A0A9P0G8E8_9CUCU|nr:unnamed protein product [Psylliodes chrysocephala]